MEKSAIKERYTKMKGIIWGAGVTIMVLIAAGLFVALTGLVSMRADTPPSRIEAILAGHAMDANVGRSAPKVPNLVAADEASLLAGAQLYREHCALCHGDPAHPKSPLADAFNPPAPQFVSDKPDMPENQNFYIIAHGIRWTGMPSWKGVLSEQQTWQVVTFLSHMDSLPSRAKEVFAQTAP
jgi:thiosulfate dehydrogenase